MATPARRASTATSAASTDAPSSPVDQAEVVHIPLAQLAQCTSQALLALGFASHHAALITEVGVIPTETCTEC